MAFNTRKALEEALKRKRESQNEGDMRILASELTKEVAKNIPADKIAQNAVNKIESALTPILTKLAEKEQLSASAIQNAIETALSKVRIDVPEVRIPAISVPEPKVTVNVPRIDVPAVNMPDEMNVKGWLGFMGYDRGLLDDPLPVQLRDANGKPVNLFENLTTLVSQAGGGGKHDYFTIKDIRASSKSLINQTDGTLNVTVDNASSIGGGTQYSDGGTAATPTGTVAMGDTGEESGNIYALATHSGVVGSSVLRVVHAADAVVSVNVVAGSASGTEYADGGTASTPTGVVAMGDTGEESGNIFALATHSGVIGSSVLRVVMATDAVASVNIVSGSSSGTQYADGATASVPTGTLAMGDTGEESGNIFSLATHSGVVGSGVLRVVHVADVGMSVTATQTGTWNIGTVTAVTGVTNSIAANVVDSGGVPYTTSNPFPVGDAGGSLTVDASNLDIRDLVNATDSVAAYQVSGAIWSTNITNTVTVTGSLTSTVVIGPTAVDANDDGSAPVQTGGIARTANPTAVTAGDVVKSTHDDLGRQVMRPIQVRDLTLTAYASLTNGTETTLRAAVAGAYLDLIYIMGANNSDAAVTVDLRAVTAGNIVMTLQIPANGTAGIACPVPLPAAETGNNWTADMGDITGTTVYLTALFSQEV